MQILTLTESIFWSWLKANRQQGLTNMIGWLGSLGRFLSGYLLMVIFSMQSIIAAIWGLLVVKCITLGISIVFANINRGGTDNTISGTGDRSSIGSISLDFFNHGLVFAGINLLTVAQNRLDWLLVSKLISTISLASYSLANKLYEIFQILIGVSLSTIYPWLCYDETVADLRSDLSLMLRGIIALGTGVALTAVFALPVLIQLLFGNKYSGIYVPLQIIMLAASLITASGVFYHIILSRKREAGVLRGITISTMLQLGTNLLLIPFLGIAGAALGMLVLTLATLIATAHITQRATLVQSAFTRRIFLFLVICIAWAVSLLGWALPPWAATIILIPIVIAISWFVLFNGLERAVLLGSIRDSMVHRRDAYRA